METENDALSKLLHTEAKKSGISGKDARKALKKLRSGGMMAQVAPQLQSTFMEMNPNQSPRDKLRAKLSQMRKGRGNKVSKEADYEKTRQRVHEKKEEDEREKESSKRRAAARRKNRNKKLRQLEKQVGEVSHEIYINCMKRVQDNSYNGDGERNRDKNLIDLYSRQQGFTDKVEMEMDDLDSDSD